MKDLLEAGVHFGHQTQRWNPKMDKFIYGAKSGIHILDLRITYDAIEQAQEYVQKLVANSGKVLFVGTKPQAQQVIEDQAIRAGMPYVNFRWLGGMLTNFKTIIKRVVYLKELKSLESSGEINAYTKSERLRIKREIEKLTKSIEINHIKPNIIIDNGTTNMFPIWAPDSNVFAYLSNKNNDYFGQTDLYIYDLDSSSEKKVSGGVYSAQHGIRW